MWRAGATAYRYRCLVPATRFLGTSVVAGETMKRLALACFLPASAAVAATATLPERYCNDRDTSCAAWGKAGECTGSNSELVKG